MRKRRKRTKKRERIKEPGFALVSPKSATRLATTATITVLSVATTTTTHGLMNHLM